MFCLGFQICVWEVFQYLVKYENIWDLKFLQFVIYFYWVVLELLQGGIFRKLLDLVFKVMDFKEKFSFLVKGLEGFGKNCVLVIQWIFVYLSGEQSGSDMDIDSGYGGELEKGDLCSEQLCFKSDYGCRFMMGERIGVIK